MRKQMDYWLYPLIAALGAAQAYVNTGELPQWLGPPLGISVAAFVALKAKRSGNGNSDSEPAPKPPAGEVGIS